MQISNNYLDKCPTELIVQFTNYYPGILHVELADNRMNTIALAWLDNVKKLCPTLAKFGYNFNNNDKPIELFKFIAEKLHKEATDLDCNAKTDKELNDSLKAALNERYSYMDKLNAIISYIEEGKFDKSDNSKPPVDSLAWDCTHFMELVKRVNSATLLQVVEPSNLTLLLEGLVDIEAQGNSHGNYGCTALLQAVKRNDADCAEILLRNKANANIRDKQGRLPLHWAAFHGNAKMTDLLIPVTTSIDAKTASDRLFAAQKALSIAARNQGMQCRFSHQENGDFGFSQETALHIAAEKGHKEVVQILLDKGANPNIQDEKGNTPFTLAQENGHAHVADLLAAFIK